MRHNIQKLLSVLTLAITLISPLKGWGQEMLAQDTVSIEKQSAHTSGIIIYGNIYNLRKTLVIICTVIMLSTHALIVWDTMIEVMQ